MSKSSDDGIILGVDPGTIITGFGIVAMSGNRLELIDYGCIRPPAKHKLSDRYLIIYDAISEIVAKHKSKTVVVETQYVGKNPLGAIKLGMARGACVIAARKGGSTVYEYAPSKAKLAVTGSGKASKYQVQRMVQQLFALPHVPEPEDAADALALAICHAHAIQTAKNLGTEL